MSKIRLLSSVLVVLFLLAASVAHAQVSDKKLQKVKKEADQYFYNREPALAVELYKEVLDADPQNFEILYKIGRCYWYLRKDENNLQQAVDWYNAAIGADPNANDTIYFDLGQALRMMGQCYAAKEQFNIFLKRHTNDDVFTAQAKLEMEGCDFAAKEKLKDPDYKVDLLGINGASDDFNPTPFYVKSDSFLIFTSHREGSKGKKKFMENGQQLFSDLWITPMENDSTFGAVENMGKKINTKANDGGAASPIVDPTGMVMYYTICGGGKYKKFYGCSIYQSFFNVEAKSWGKFQKVEGINGKRNVVINSKGKTKEVPTYDAQPALSNDGQIMFFISDRDGGEGETDIYYSMRSGDAWGTPVNCGPSINTPFSEIYPWPGQDGKTLYYATDGLPGFGGFDIYKAEGSQAAWGKPTNMGQNVNTSFDDFALVWTIQDSVGYLSSDRPNGAGRDDIYRVKKIYREPIVITVKGNVRDSATKQVIPFAIVTRYEVTAGGQLIPIDTFRTDQTGKYNFTLEKEKTYKLIGSAPEYLVNSVSVTTVGVKKSTDFERDIDIYLERITLGKPIVLQNIYFDFDSSAIRADARPTLDKLVALLQNNPNITIQLGAHTDTNGSEQYNIKLSDKRAKSVVKYLIDNGIAAERLSSFGFGESQPAVYPELSDADEQMNRRVEFRINSFNYKPGAEKPKK